MKIQFALACTALSATSLLTACASGPNSGPNSGLSSGLNSGPNSAHGSADAATRHLVSEDDHVRIDELRVRGQTQRLSVQNKGSRVPGYDILPPTGGNDPSKSRDAAGQRVWPVLTF
jgi:hypothetical protein